MENTISKGDPGYDKLYEVWVAEKKPGFVVLPGGTQFKAIKSGTDEETEEDIVVFARQGGFDEMYGSRTTRGLAS
jgi:hypothetical protein